MILLTTLSGCDLANNLTPINKTLADAAPKVLKANVFKIEFEEDVVETAVFFGKLTPNRQSRLAFARGGRVKSVFKQVGDKVTAGEKLAELEQTQLETQKRDLEQALANAQPSTPTEGPPPNQQQIEQLQASLQEIESQLSNGTIVAPYDCLISEKNIDIGSAVSVQLPAFQVVENANPVVETNLTGMIANGLEIGQSVWIIIANETAQARVKSKSPNETPAGTRTVLLQVSSQLESIPWSFGQTVEIRFFVPTDNSGYWVPLTALNREATGLWSIFVAEPNADADTATAESLETRAARKMVELVQLEDDWALVRGALSDNQAVIVNGSHRIVPGQTVEPNDITDDYTRPDALGADE
jgi:multidrug efflux pump subunit AcrA (membrane-fusion protein)